MKTATRKSLFDYSKSRVSQDLIERAMQLRCLSYMANVKHRLLMQTIMEIDKSKKGLVQSNYQLRELERLKTIFIASMTHELNSPLAAIMGFTGLLLDPQADPLTDKQHEYLTYIQKSVEQLSELVSDTLNVAKVEAGKVDIKITPVAIKLLIDDVVTGCMGVADKKGLSIRVAVAENLSMHTDGLRLLQCVQNLVSNAIKYTESGFIEINAQEDGDVINISVADSGLGISAADMEILFDPFVRLESKLRTQETGSGIGLYLTKKLTENVLQGTIHVQSHPGQGSVFTLVLPKTLAAGRAAASL